MAKSVELTEKELKEVSGGAYIKDGYLYYSYKGQNVKWKIYSAEKDIQAMIDYCNSQGLSDEDIAARLWIFSEMKCINDPEVY